MTSYSRCRPHNSECGFTLTELAIVLVIVGLLLGGMMVPLSAQRDIQKANETQKQLAEIKEALLGFAVIYRRLPCPTTTADPSSGSYGVEDAACADTEGYLPWKSLGISETDAWGSRRTQTTDPFLGYWRYRVDNNFTASPIALSTKPTATSELSIEDAAGNTLTKANPDSPVAVIYSTGKNLLADGKNASDPTGDPKSATYQAGEQTATFDDITIWITRPILFNRMISAGQLP